MNKKHKITTIINYCTNDFRYLKKCIEEAKLFSQEVIVSVCDHFFNGDKENDKLLKAGFYQNSDVSFIQFAYSKDKLYSPFIDSGPSDVYWNAYWHGTNRYVGFFHLKKDTEYILFLDVDEIVEGKEFLKWLNTNKYLDYDAVRFFCYYYFIKPSHQAKTYQKLISLIKRSAIKPSMLINVHDRHGVFGPLKNKIDEVLSFKGLPMFHHYCWVRTKEECIKKTKTWAHYWEEDWQQMIEKEYAKKNPGKDFVFGWDYQTVEPYFDPFRIKFPQTPYFKEPFPNVTYCDFSKTQRKSLEWEFSL